MARSPKRRVSTVRATKQPGAVVASSKERPVALLLGLAQAAYAVLLGGFALLGTRDQFATISYAQSDPYGWTITYALRSLPALVFAAIALHWAIGVVTAPPTERPARLASRQGLFVAAFQLLSPLHGIFIIPGSYAWNGALLAFGNSGDPMTIYFATVIVSSLLAILTLASIFRGVPAMRRAASLLGALTLALVVEAAAFALIAGVGARSAFGSDITPVDQGNIAALGKLAYDTLFGPLFEIFGYSNLGTDTLAVILVAVSALIVYPAWRLLSGSLRRDVGLATGALVTLAAASLFSVVAGGFDQAITPLVVYSSPAGVVIGGALLIYFLADRIALGRIVLVAVAGFLALRTVSTVTSLLTQVAANPLDGIVPLMTDPYGLASLYAYTLPLVGLLVVLLLVWRAASDPDAARA